MEKINIAPKKSKKKYVLLVIIIIMMGITFIAVYDPFNKPYIAKLSKVAERGDGEAAWCVHLYYLSDKDAKQSDYWLQKSAMNGYPRAQYLWSGKLIYSNSPQKKQEGMDILLKAAEHNYPPAQAEIGSLYYFGALVGRDENRSEYWYRRASRNGINFAMLTLAKLLLDQKNDRNSLIEAYSWAIIGYNRSDSSILSEEQKSLPETIMNKAKKLGYDETMIKQTSEAVIRNMEAQIASYRDQPPLDDFSADQCEAKVK